MPYEEDFWYCYQFLKRGSLSKPRHKIRLIRYHPSARKERSYVKISKDYCIMACLVDKMPIIWWQIWNFLSVINKDMGTLTCVFWQPWNKKCHFIGFWWCWCNFQGSFEFSGLLYYFYQLLFANKWAPWIKNYIFFVFNQYYVEQGCISWNFFKKSTS